MDTVIDLPNRKTESFKYTDLSRILSGHSFHQDLSKHQALKLSCNMPSAHIMPDGIKECCLPEGVEISALDASAQAYQDFFDREIDFKRHPMAAKALENTHTTSVLNITSVLNRPIELSFNLNTTNLWWNCVTLIQVDAGCEAEIEYVTDLPESNLLNQLMLIKVDDNAKLRINIRRGKQPESQHLHNMQIYQQQDSSVDVFYPNDGEALGRYDAHAFLCGKAAEFRAAGFYRLKNKEHVDHHLLVEHLADHTTSKQFFKGIIDDKAHGVFNGAANVHAGVKHADANQHNYNLLLSKTAAIDTKPELEIYTDVVTAAHGAAVGRLDQEALFYLQSRGISPDKAKQMLIDAFFADVLNFFT